MSEWPTWFASPGRLSPSGVDEGQGPEFSDHPVSTVPSDPGRDEMVLAVREDRAVLEQDEKRDQPMTGLASEKTAIVLKTRWPPLWLVFGFFIFRTIVTVDGVTSLLPTWGEHVLPVVPGPHEVQVSLGRSIGGRRPMSGARIQVEVARGETVHLRYQVPSLYLSNEGSLEIVQ